ncbi:Hypothetical protein GLP15_1543 [Giardia lamblia P15]|uniref:Uncharacterized protein n=1 Tax=Giardia intestinalis (strain P15) TaxID=658858 RepID=E1EXK5_GIAIA|nr:Hypothetical protein GLP15_1543 [Giardia lamblia P15]
MQEDAPTPSTHSLQHSKHLSRAYKDIAKNAKINLDSMEAYARELVSLDAALSVPSGPRSKRGPHQPQRGLSSRNLPKAGGGRYQDAGERSSDATDDESECMLISCVVVIVRHIVFAFRSAEHLERFSREIKRYNEEVEVQSILRIYITLDGSASSYHVCDLTNKQLSLLLTKGLYHETDVPDTGMGYIHLVRFPLMAAVKLPFIESAGMQVNIMGRILTQGPEDDRKEIMKKDVTMRTVPFSAKCDLPNLLKPIYDNVVISSGKAVTHTSYLGLPSTAELLYDSEKMTEHGLPLVGTLQGDAIKHYRFLMASDFNEISCYPAALSFIGYIFCNSGKADEFIRRYKQKTELVALISRSSTILTGTLKEQRLVASASTYTHEDIDFLRCQYCDALLSGEGALIRSDKEGDYYMRVSNEKNARQSHRNIPLHKGAFISGSPQSSSLSVMPPLPSQHLSKYQKPLAPEECVPILVSNMECRYLPNDVSTVTLELIFGSYQVHQALQPVPATDGHAMWVGEAVTLHFNPYKIVPYIEFILRGYDIKGSLCYSDVAILSLVSLFTTKILQGWTPCKVVGQLYSRITTPLVDQAIISGMSVFTETGQICNLQHDTIGLSDQDLTTTYQSASNVGHYSNYHLNNANDDSILSVISEAADIDQHIRNISRFGPVSNDEDPLSILCLSATRPIGGNRDASTLKTQLQTEHTGDVEDYASLKNDMQTAAVLFKYGCDNIELDRKYGDTHGRPAIHDSPAHNIRHSSDSSSSYDDGSSHSSGFSVDLYTSLERPKPATTQLPGKTGIKSQGHLTIDLKHQVSSDSSSYSSGDSELSKKDGDGKKKQMPDKQWLLERARDVFQRRDSSDDSSDFDY